MSSKLNRRRSGRDKAVAPGIESLEGRRLLTASLTTLNGVPVLRIEGTSAADTVLITSGVRVGPSRNAIPVVRVQENGGALQSFDAADFKKISVVTLGGNDTINASLLEINRPVVANGGGGRDLILGSPFGDTLTGSGGMDTIRGGNGNDVIHGGSDNDVLDGQLGEDVVNGDGGNDVLSDTLDAIPLPTVDVEDIVAFFENAYAAIDDDGTITPDEFDFVLSSFDQADFLEFAAYLFDSTLSVNILDGGTGDDTITGGNGIDVLYGRDGADVMSGGGSMNLLFGGNHNDTMTGGSFVDIMLGESGADVVNGGGGLGTNIISGGIGNDTLTGADGVDWVLGDEGDDVIRGRLLADFLHGGDGFDTEVVEGPLDFFGIVSLEDPFNIVFGFETRTIV